VKHDIYVGLISGTSMDAIDAVAVRFGKQAVSICGQLALPYCDDLRSDIARAAAAARYDVDELGMLDIRIGRAFSDAAVRVVQQAGATPQQIVAIGSHGQTIRHRPDGPAPFSMQLGNGAVIAARTGIATVCDFRNTDIELGGQGAPLVPAFHGWLFASETDARAVVNIGGIGNVTILDRREVVGGYDTGPGNTLMDAWTQRHRDEAYDNNGAWAAAGRVDADLLEVMLTHPYFAKPSPKSTGPEEFNLEWVDACIDRVASEPDAGDVLTTLAELTALTIAMSIRDHPRVTDIAVCGGGASNAHLMERLTHHAGSAAVTSTQQWGLAPDWVEACAFAWLARARLSGVAGNVPAVTGARRPAILGAVYSSD
jgi:anhydro-N-acetylmuramic acid kinase